MTPASMTKPIILSRTMEPSRMLTVSSSEIQVSLRIEEMTVSVRHVKDDGIIVIMKGMRYDLLVVEFHIVRHSLYKFKFQKNETKKLALDTLKNHSIKNALIANCINITYIITNEKADEICDLVRTYVSTNEDLKWPSPGKKSVLSSNLEEMRKFGLILIC
jgi:hypothetical protein